MPSIEDVFGGSTLKASDVKGKNPTVTIDNVQVKEFKDKDGSTKKKLMVTFVGAKKALVCNVTNARRIAHLHGEDYAQWPGKKIALHADMVDFGGQVTDGIRVYPPSNGKITSGPVVREEMDDDIPF